MNTPHAITPTDSRDVPRGTRTDLAGFAHARASDDEPDDPAVLAIVCLAWLVFVFALIVGAGAWPFLRAWWAAL